MRFDSAAVDHHCHFLFKFKAFSLRALCSITRIISLHARSARFQPRGLISSTALHHYNKAKLTRLKLTIRHQCLNLRIIPSVSFGDLQFASLVAARPKIWVRQISHSARIFFYMLTRDIEWCMFSAEKLNFVLDLNVLVLYVHTYCFPPDRFRRVGQKTSN